jgi:hypothetical protein
MKKKTKKNTMRYVRAMTVPRKIPPGRVLMHDIVAHGPEAPCGAAGFRCWFDVKPYKGFVLCPCGYAGLKHYAAKAHAELWRKDPERMRRSASRWAEELTAEELAELEKHNVAKKADTRRKKH